MYIRCFRKSRYNIRSLLHTGIVLVWVAGLALGCSAVRFYGDVYCGLLESAAMHRPDFAGLSVINLIPLLISAAAVNIYPELSYILCLCRGFLLGFGLGACVLVYGTAGMMMAWLLLFSFLLFSPVLLWYWSCVMQGQRITGRDTLMCACGAFVLAWAEHWVIVPFLQEIMIF